MRVAVVGAGLAGLGATYFLLKKGFEVTLVHTGGGASEIPIGLCHPYPGRSGKLSQFGYEALELTKELIGMAEKASGKELADRGGILRRGWTPEQWYPDLEEGDGGIWIRSGLTVYMQEYVEVLRKLFGVRELSEYDRIVYASGSNIPYELPVNHVKGQVVIGKSERRQSVMQEHGHLSPIREGLVQVGSTYEHGFASSEPDVAVAERDLSKKLDSFFPDGEFAISDCRAGVRVAVKGSYLPIVKQIDEKSFVYTGLGSRGLLYHAYYGRHLANLVE